MAIRNGCRRDPFGRRSGRNGPLSRVAAAVVACVAAAGFSGGIEAVASLDEYDAVVEADSAAGLTPAARLTEAAVFSGGAGRPFHFGAIDGDGTFECIVEGAGGVRSGYLAVGVNATSNLRLQQYQTTDQLGLTQLGVADYLFSPPVPTPLAPVHLAYVWDGAGTMRLYLNGMLAGTCGGVTASFGLPTGQGWLGSNPTGGEGMVGTIHRVVCYDVSLDEAVLRRRAEAYLGIKNPPEITVFTAEPAAIATGGEATLSWSVSGADSVRLDGDDVSGEGARVVNPVDTMTYTLSATNEHGVTERTVTVSVLRPADHLVINEFLASNHAGLADEDGELSDWLELHNPTAAGISLAGYYLTDNPSRPQQWALPAVALPAGGYRLVFLSGKDRAPVDGEWHGNFRLGREGEYLALTGPSGMMHEFSPAFPPQEDDVSYGLIGADPGLAGYLASPTPGAPNDPTPPRPARVTFSQPPGLLVTPINVELATVTPGAEIRYQLNNESPRTYDGPLTIAASTQVRAWAEKNGRSSQASRAAWVKLAPDFAAYTSPLPVLVIDNFAGGIIPQKGWSGDGSGVQQVPRQSAVWIGWERHEGGASPARTPQFFSRIGVRGRGAYSSTWRQKTYNVETWDEADEELDLPILGMPAHSDWVLYYPDPDENKDPTLLFNTFVYDLSRRLGRYAPRFRWVEVFVNEDGGEVSLQDRRGVYAVMEKVSRGAERLDFERLNPEGTRGGWLLNLNRMDPHPEDGWPAPNGATTPQFFRTAGPNRIQESVPNQPAALGDDLPRQSNGFLNFDNPGGYVITPVQRAAIEGWFREFEDVLYNNSLWRHPVEGYRRWLDERDFAEYFIFNELTRNGDGMLLSMFPWKGDDGRLRMGPTWDYNWSSYHIGGAPGGDLRWRSNQIWYQRLFNDPDFMQLYIDRWFAFRTGAMSNEGMAAVIDEQAADITEAKAVQQGISSAAAWRNRLAQMKSWLRQRADWVDGQYAPPPTLSAPSGIVAAGRTVTLAASQGTVYFLGGGGDPRAPGGAIASGAQTGPELTLTGDLKLTARTRVSNSRWSAPVTALYVTDAVPATAENLVISEIHYHPADPTPEDIAAGFTDANLFEFIELANIGPQKISLSGLRFVRGADGGGAAFSFDEGDLWSIAPGERLVVAHDTAAFARRYGPGLPVAGAYTGRLGNSGDTLTLLDAAGAVLLAVAFSDTTPWPEAADGRGWSLTLLAGLAAADLNQPGSWRASVSPGGSPGTSDSLPLAADEDAVAYALGGFPTTWDWSDGHVTVRQARVPGTDAVTVALEFSADLGNWTQIGPAETSGTATHDGGLVLERGLPLLETAGFIRWRVAPRVPGR